MELEERKMKESSYPVDGRKREESTRWKREKKRNWYMQEM